MGVAMAAARPSTAEPALGPARVSLVRLRELPARQLWPVAPAASAFLTGGIGYLGAVADDQVRWSAGFRRLLDSLSCHLQVVMRFRCGRPASAIDRPSGQQREVIVAVPVKYGTGLIEGLAGLGLTVIAAPTLRPAETFGRETARACSAGARWHRTWYVERFPGGELEPGWLLRLVPAGVDLDLAWHVDPIATGWAVDFLQRQLAQLRASQLEGQSRGVSDTELAAALPAAADLQRKLSASQERAFHLAFYVTVSAENEAELELAAARVEDAARASLCTIRETTFRQFEGRLATLPAGVDPLRRLHVVDTSSVGTFFPWLEAEVFDPAGILVGHSRATSAPVQIDPFESSHHENANIAVFGHSGAGKTYLLSTIALAAASAGWQTFIIDPEHEYGPLARAAGGADVQLALGSRYSLNVMDMRGEVSDENRLGPAVADTVDLIETICGGVDEAEKALLEATVRLTYQEEAAPVLRDVAVRLPASARVARILGRWVQGSLGAMFSRPTNVDLDLPLIAFGMRELREEMIGPVHFLLAEALWRRFRDRSRRRLLVVDELALLFEDAIMRRFVVRLARRIRKYDGALVFATQNAGDLLGSEAGMVVATNPALRFFGAQRPSEAQKLQRAFQLSDIQRQGLETARRGEFLLAAGHRRLPIHVRAEGWQEEIMKVPR